MRILYVAKHDSGGNDDEGAISHALETLGHRVERVRESKGQLAHRVPADLLLFHHWDDVASLKRIGESMLRAMWCFDLIEWPSDPTLAARCARRVAWMDRVLPHVEHAFCTDGDWALKRNLHWLLQGADERIVGRGRPAATSCDVLFVGESRGGVEREKWWKLVQEKYGGRAQNAKRSYREALRDWVAEAAVVLAPSSPATDRYWSNRVYLVAGFGGFLVHPRCAGLEAQYGNSVEWYDSPRQMLKLVDWALNLDRDARMRGSEDALQKTIAANLYRHRLERLLSVCQNRS